jgi:D-arabinose 1-dehydrogenase-like Zn-dependent alcohol dehydrogenase
VKNPSLAVKSFLPLTGQCARGSEAIFFIYSRSKKWSQSCKKEMVIVGMGGVGGPAAMLSRKLMPEFDITIIREEDRFIVR